MASTTPTLDIRVIPLKRSIRESKWTVAEKMIGLYGRNGDHIIVELHSLPLLCPTHSHFFIIHKKDNNLIRETIRLLYGQFPLYTLITIQDLEDRELNQN